ncbi:hypothetical protein SAMN05216236_1593 [Sedimentitalea nanhaiensis]|uniref:Transposase InsH N-terminal domain-containing protein n=1 Tax=Sedimentitalea nanhaiensis TaxID=999627 RepID=A0A1I7EBC4_9RHOB|nr:hypothetical protein SAMN05216236_1593 [Sedimentitalea nanhaiensis]
MVDMRHELVALETLIDWDVFEREWVGFFPSHTGRPATMTRLVAGLLYLQHAYALSTVAGSLSGRRSMTRRRSRSQIIVPYRCPLRQAQSSIPMTRRSLLAASVMF